MTKINFEEYLHSNIPVTSAMGFRVNNFSKKEVKIGASINKNINHEGTAFGGTVASLLTVTAFARVLIIMEEIDANAHIVIQNSSINYLLPLAEDFEASSPEINESAIEKFARMYLKHRKSRIAVYSCIEINNNIAAELNGEFVVFSSKKI